MYTWNPAKHQNAFHSLQISLNSKGGCVDISPYSNMYHLNIKIKMNIT